MLLNNVIVQKIYIVDKNRNIHIESKYAYIIFPAISIYRDNFRQK